METVREAWDRLVDEYETDVFLQPEIYEGDYGELEDPHGETIYVPKEFVQDVVETGYFIADMGKGFLVRSSAPGYLDSTDWEPVSTVQDLENWFEMNYVLIDEDEDEEDEDEEDEDEEDEDEEDEDEEDEDEEDEDEEGEKKKK
jgi:hypothetical protein